MKFRLLIILFFSLLTQVIGQTFPSPPQEFFGKVCFDNEVIGGSADVVVDLVNFTDQTVHNHVITDVAIGDVIFDQSGNVWEIVVINFITPFAANVDLFKIYGFGSFPFGNSNLARPTTNLKLIPTSTVNAIGISEKVQAEISNYNNWRIDEFLGVGVQGVTGTGVDNTDPLNPVINQSVFFPIWAEENANITNNSRQWSFGNGSIGVNNIVIPIDCEIQYLTLSAETAGISLSIDILIDDTIVETIFFNGNNKSVTIANPTNVSAGQRIGFRSNTETGSYRDVRVCAWLLGKL